MIADMDFIQSTLLFGSSTKISYTIVKLLNILLLIPENNLIAPLQLHVFSKLYNFVPDTDDNSLSTPRP